MERTAPLTKDERQERWHPYYEAFYGKGFPIGQVCGKDHDAFFTMCENISDDLNRQYPDADDTLKRKAILAALNALHQAKVDHPNGYNVPIYAREAGMAAATIISSARVVEQTKKVVKDLDVTAISDEKYAELEKQQGRAAQIYATYHGFHDQNIREGMERINAKVSAYIQCIEAYPRPEGYDYYVLGMKLPCDPEVGVYNEPEVIEAMNAHPTLRKMGRKKGGGKFMVNGRKFNMNNAVQELPTP